MKRFLLFLAPVLLSCGPPPVEVVDLLPRFADTMFVPREPAADLRRGELAGVPSAAQSFVLGDGWAAAGENGTWAVGLRAELGAHLEDDRARTLVFEARSRPGCSPEAPQVVTLEVNGSHCRPIEVANSWSRHSIGIPDGVLQPGENDLSLHFRDAASPHELGLGNDTRNLAACFRRIGLLSGSISLEAALAAPVEIDPTSGNLRIIRSGTFVLPLALHPGRSRLTLRGRPAGGEAALALRLMDAEGSTEDLPNAEISAGDRPIDLGARNGGLHFLLLEVDPSPGGAVVIERAQLETPLAQPPARRNPASAAGLELPDIVVLIPDALRPDHLGCYGSPRPTSPNMDALAAESLVFTDAIATASYTLCSTPTIITGVGFEGHGMVSENQSLADRFTTLAEYLASAGYATAGFSGNAFHSTRFGSDQGYDTFEMMWRLIPDELASFNPHTMVDLALEWLADQPGDRPILLLLHLVPPHAPYEPTPPFDVFGDPGYQGDVDGSRANLQAIRTATVDFGEPDLERLISLYDGNILRVDDAIGRLLEALRSRARWSETAVLVISDHGEAFFEHGFQGHVNTVYDEMLKVPFILRVPGWRRSADIDTGRHASLADVVPTLLALAGVEPAPEVAGIDLLTPPQSPLGDRDRFVISRNGGYDWTTYSIRAGRFKAVVDEIRRRELYDLTTDPAERQNLAPLHPLLLAGFTQLLREELERSSPATTDGATLDPEDEAALRALGYL